MFDVLFDFKIKLTFLNESDPKDHASNLLGHPGLSFYFLCVFLENFLLACSFGWRFLEDQPWTEKKAFEEKEGSSYSIYSSSYTMQTNDFKPTFIPIVTIQSVTRETDSHL